MRHLKRSALRTVRGELPDRDELAGQYDDVASRTAVLADESLLLKIEDVATLLRMSVRSVNRLRSAGDLPDPVELLSSVRWRRADIEAWVAAGCPKHENSR